MSNYLFVAEDLFRHSIEGMRKSLLEGQIEETINLLDFFAAAHRQSNPNPTQPEDSALDALLGNAFEGVTLLDATGRIRQPSPNTERLLGRPPEVATGMDVLTNVHPDDRDRIAGLLERVACSPGGQVTGETRYRHGDGSWRRVEFVATNLLDCPDIAAIVLNFRDATPLVETAEALALERERLADSFIRVNRLESLGTMAGGIAHDFNNLLLCIAGHISIAMLHGVSDQARSKLKESERACYRAKSLSIQLSSLARGGIALRETTSLAPHVTEVVDFCLNGRKVERVFHFADDLWPVEIDTGQIGQVFQNLAINAVEAMPNGGTVTVRGENVAFGPDTDVPPGRYVKLTFSDTGCGIPSEMTDKVFDPYFTTKSRGSGLGLSVVASIVSRHGGFLRMDSTVGVGTRFSIFLPAFPEPVRPYGFEILADDARSAARGKVLYLEDTESLHAIARAALAEIGLEVECVRNGKEAVERYRRARERRHPYLATILNLNVPGGLDGREVLEKLLALDPDVRAVACSGVVEDPVMADPEKFGFAARLGKPFSLEEMRSVVAAALGTAAVGGGNQTIAARTTTSVTSSSGWRPSRND